jgi:hypothetical protein
VQTGYLRGAAGTSAVGGRPVGGDGAHVRPAVAASRRTKAKRMVATLPRVWGSRGTGVTTI